MRSKVIVAAIFSVGFAGASQAADISEQGATDLRNVLTESLSRDLIRSDFVTVKPAGDQYEITYDLAKFFDKINSSVLSVTGFKPLSLFAQPVEKGRWHLKGDNSLDIAVHSPTSDIAYSIGSSSFDGIFDPAIEMMRSMGIKSSGVKFSSVGSGAKSGRKVDASIDSASFAHTVTDNSETGKVDLQMQGSLQRLSEQFTLPRGLLVSFSADSVISNVTATSLPAQELRALIRFFVQHVKTKQLSESGSEKFEQLVHRALPIFGSLTKTVTLSNAAVATDKGKVGVKRVDYSFKMDGLTKASNVNLELRAEHFTPDADLIPAAYAPFLPETLDVQLGVPNINFSGLIDTALDAVATRETPMSGEVVKRTMFPSGYGTLEFPKISATSGVYDIEASGTLKGSTKAHTDYSLQATILARDFDKTVSAIQEAAKAEPRLNRVSFSLLAAKGFAKTDPDGRLRWDVTMDESRTVTVNGQVMKKP
ncbi:MULTISPECIES: hypothetical protein [Rhizobium]|uniref:DUF945 domain-containing protein n=1 Tax=Rhizobium miluonense TaxID=411945 RepID=A0A1C3X5X5_9HYPH|nr:hypothetical protein [Rhizobium miluonense]SCB47662.1 hypothetical protein GA0061102_106026 [Rhizobium miluonense]